MDRLTYKLRDLWAYLSEHPTASNHEVQIAMGYAATSSAYYLLRRLEATGYIQRGPAHRDRARRIVVPLLTHRTRPGLAASVPPEREAGGAGAAALEQLPG